VFAEYSALLPAQLLLTLAYTFTDYSVQGQSLRQVPLVDAHKTTNGKLSAFNVYVTWR